MEEPKDIFSYINSKKDETPDESYFHALAEKIIHQKESKLKTIPIFKKPIFKWAVTASILLPLAIYFINQKSTTTSNDQPVLLGMNEIPREDIHEYIMENIEDFNLDEVSEMVSEEVIESFETKAVTLKTETTSDFFEELTPEEIKSYFETEDIDLEELEEEGVFI